MRQRPLLLVFVTLMITACFTYYAVSDCLRDRAVCFGVGGNDAQMAPYKYRLLEPAIVRLANPSGSQDGAAVAVIVIYGVLTAVTLPLLYSWLSRWMNEDRAMLGVMVYGLVQVGAFHLWYLTLGTTIEVFCVVAVLALIDCKWWWIAPVLVVASLNRETAVLLVGIYAAWNLDVMGVPSNRVKGSIILFAIWAVITTALHLILGPSQHVNGNLLGMLAYNLGNLPDAFFANLILSPLYYLAWRGYRNADPQLRRMMWVVLVYLVAVAGGGNVGEIQRYILPVAPILLAVILGLPGGELSVKAV